MLAESGFARKIEEQPESKKALVSVPARILVVEDEGIVGLDIQSTLEAMGYDVPTVVSTAQDAMASTEWLRPDLFLMNIQLEGDVDGVDAAERIGADYEIPVVYLTAYSDETTLARAITAQTFGYLLKPFEERELYTTVEVALFRHRAGSEKAELEERVCWRRRWKPWGSCRPVSPITSTSCCRASLALDLSAMSAGNDLRPFLHDATYDAERAARLIRQLMLFHKDEESHLRIDALDLLREVANVCRGVLPRDIDFHVDAPERLPALRVQLVCCDDVDGRRCPVGNIGRSCRRQTGKGGRFFIEKTRSSTGDGSDCPAARVAGKTMASTVPAPPTRRRSATGREPDIDVVMRRRTRRIGIILSQRLVPSLTTRYDFPPPDCVGVSPPVT